ncbi:radical SAM protein [Spirochaeta dissipatitropha]
MIRDNNKSQDIHKIQGFRSLYGIRRRLLKIRVILGVFFHFLPLMLRGRLSPRRFTAFSRRMLLFLRIIDHNKFAVMGGGSTGVAGSASSGSGARLELYLPSYPSRAFFHAAEKFLEFDDMFPCTTVLLSITSACKFACPHCYQRLDKGQDMDIERLVEIARHLQNSGVAFFNIEGGDPFLKFDRLTRLCAAIDDRSEIWINTTGEGLTVGRLTDLKSYPVTALMFSLRAADREGFARCMGSDRGWDLTREGIRLCREAGLIAAANSCLSRDDFYNGTFEKVMNLARDWGISILQLIHPKPAGAWLVDGPQRFSQDDLTHAKELVTRYNQHPDYRDYPPISAQLIEESSEVFGCTAGGTDRFYINAKGDVQPCEFLNISYGNVLEEDFARIYARMRSDFSQPGTAWLCEQCSPGIRELYLEENRGRLPLTPESSSKISGVWDPGGMTPIYRKLYDLK